MSFKVACRRAAALDCLDEWYVMLRRANPGYGGMQRNPSVHGLGGTSHQNPLGRVSIRRPSAEELERASVVSIKS